MGQTIRDTSPTLVAGHNTPRTFPSKQANLKSLSEFEVVVDVVVVVVVTAMVVVAVVVVLFDLRSIKSKILCFDEEDIYKQSSRSAFRTLPHVKDGAFCEKIVNS